MTLILPNGGLRKRDVQIVRRIQQGRVELCGCSPGELRLRSDDFRVHLFGTGKSPLAEEVVVGGSALLGETIHRVLGFDLYDVQILAGVAMTRGAVVEMQTGEGKTLAAAIPAFLHGLCGRGVHVVTSNAYLAERDFLLMRPVFEMLGLSVGLLPEMSDHVAKQLAYDCDITYGCGYEFGFDYLRDQVEAHRECRLPVGYGFRNRLHGIVGSRSGLQRRLAAAIVDEADHVLIDEACSPLVISDATGAPAEDADLYHVARECALSLASSEDFRHESIDRTPRLTERGIAHIHSLLPRSAHAQLNRPWKEYVEQALVAEYVLRRDVHYVLAQGFIRIVDGGTGRIFENRFWQDGLHQAIQAKERLAVRGQPKVQAQISRQRYFRMYPFLCGTTGTALECSREFRKIYGLSVVEIPLRSSSRRIVRPADFFRDHASKWQALITSISEFHHRGQPVLIGTRSIADSELLAAALDRRRLTHQLLNGRQDVNEAIVVAQAGQQGAITIATNLAGRGTDIPLDDAAKQVGGLHVIGADHQESRRLDRQLVGRCARQGDDGSAQFFVSAEDDLLVREAPWLSQSIQRSTSADGESALQLEWQIDFLQRYLERRNYQHRRRLQTADANRGRILERVHGFTYRFE